MSSESPSLPHVLVKTDTEKPIVWTNGDMEMCAYTQHCEAAHEVNEDAACIVHAEADYSLMCVADGVGGSRAGSRASEMMTMALSRTCAAPPNSVGWRDIIVDTYDQVNAEIIEHAKGSATTALTCQIHNGRARFYHVGDSVGMVVSKKGSIRFQTIDQSPVGYAVDCGAMTIETALHHPYRHIVSNVMGSDGMHTLLSHEIELQKGDSVLLASDGLSDNLFPKEIADAVRKGSIEEAVTRLVTIANLRMQGLNPDDPSKPDDLTIVLCRPKQRAGDYDNQEQDEKKSFEEALEDTR